MSEEKLRMILQVMDGITYLEWKKMKSCIEQHFSAEISIQNNHIPLTGTELIVAGYRRDYSLTT